MTPCLTKRYLVPIISLVHFGQEVCQGPSLALKPTESLLIEWNQMSGYLITKSMNRKGYQV
jgi:hypothetical protein